MKLLLLLGLVVGSLKSGYGYYSERETVNGHLDFTHSSKSLNEYFPDLTSAIELPVLKYRYDWKGAGDEESLVIPLYDCTSEPCNQCTADETALLVEVLNWELVCQELPFHVSMVDQRSIGSDENNEEAGTSSIQQSTGELTGAPASSSSTAVLAGLQAQNKAYDPEETEESEERPSGRSIDVAATTTVATTTTATTTAAPTTDLPDPKSHESDGATEARAAVPEAAAPTSTTTTTTEAPVEATEPTVVAAVIEPADEASDEEKSDISESNEASTEASATASSSTDAAEIEDEPESDVGLQDDEYTLKPKEDNSSEDKTQEDSEQDSDEESLFEDKETRVDDDVSEEPDQINLQRGIHSDEAASWKSKYFTILGFFICFFIAFVIIIIFVIIKMKKKRAAPPTMIGATTGNVSPGPALERSFHTGDENEPLTPAVPAGASTFKFDGTKTHTPLPR